MKKKIISSISSTGKTGIMLKIEVRILPNTYPSLS